jgi:PatG Domain
MDAGSATPQQTEHDVETATTNRSESPPPERGGQPLPGSGRYTPASPSFVYALGQIEPRFPSLAVEKEFAQSTGRADAAGLTDREALQTILTDRANRYLARQLCWVFMIERLET